MVDPRGADEQAAHSNNRSERKDRRVNGLRIEDRRSGKKPAEGAQLIRAESFSYFKINRFTSG